MEPGCTAHITPDRDVRIDVGQHAQREAQQAQQEEVECDPIQLAIFSHRCAACWCWERASVLQRWARMRE